MPSPGATPTASESASPRPSTPPPLLSRPAPAEKPGRSDTEAKAERYAVWLDDFGATTFSAGKLTTNQHDLERLANRYGGKDDANSILLTIPGRGSQVRTELATAARRLGAGQRALKKRQYSVARDSFGQATAALAKVESPLHTDLLAVEGANGLRMTQYGAVSGKVEGVLATINHWVDGDTVDTSAGRVRVIGINTPELENQCGPAQKAKDAAERLAPPGQPVRLVNPDSVQDTDRYGRLLRFIDVPTATSASDGAVDVGYSLLLNNLAEARYDSEDGYQWHPRESAYRSTKAKAATGPDSGCTALDKSAAFFLVSTLARTTGQDEYGRRHLLTDLIPHPHLSAAKYLSKYVSSVKRHNAKLAQAKRDRAERIAASRRHAERVRAERARSKSSSSRPKKKSSGSKSSHGGHYPGYTGPRCYAPGGKTWKPC